MYINLKYNKNFNTPDTTLMNGIIVCYMFRFQRNHHQAIRTQYLNHICSWCFYFTLQSGLINYLLNFRHRAFSI